MKLLRNYLIFLLALGGTLHSNDKINEALTEAYTSYQKGLSTSDIQEKENAFNHSLKLYSDVENMFTEEDDLGKLYYNIGNNYAQLDQNPWAILYYYKALKTHPHDQNIINNLRYLQGQVGIDKKYISPIVTYADAVTLFAFFAALVWVSLSLYIWQQNRRWIPLAWITALVSLFFLVVSYERALLSPQEGVIIHPTLMFRGPNSEAPIAFPDPIYLGNRVNILNVSNDGKWLKVTTENDKIGYINYEHIRKI